ncbi:hypothetical protein [Nocardia acidivorans]|uniref:hypothetical protein n=1 Tax=Nocardia acidivorans TaxID=404580 RepID=UPI0012F86724|nr:hypothetical protein [Nocardia acidivorans]
MPGVASLPVLYLAKNFTTGDTFVIYAPNPNTLGTVYTVAHLSGTPAGTQAPILCRVTHPDLALYAAGAVRIMRKRHPDTDVTVCINTAPWPLAAALPR